MGLLNLEIPIQCLKVLKSSKSIPLDYNCVIMHVRGHRSVWELRDHTRAKYKTIDTPKIDNILKIFNMLSIFGVSVLYFIKILSGSRNTRARGSKR